MREKIIEYTILFLLFSMFWESCERDKIKNIDQPEANDDRSIDRNNLVNAFIMVESGGNDKAVNKVTKATGCLQQMPIMIKEANRLVGYEKYKLSDRTDREKSVEIFHLIMEKKNPEYDIARACIIWNPRGGYGYLLKIEKTYKQLIKNN